MIDSSTQETPASMYRIKNELGQSGNTKKYT